MRAEPRAVDGEAVAPGAPGANRRTRPLVVHVTTTDISLVTLLGSQMRALVAAGFEVVGASAPGPWAARLAEWGIPHHPLVHATRAFAPGRDGRAAHELYRLFRDLRPDLVHTHNPKPGVYGRLAARAARVPVVVNTVHGLYAVPEDRWARRAAVYALERLAASCSHAELVQNVEDLTVLRRLGVPERKLRLLGNGVDLERFDPARADQERVRALRTSFGAGPSDVVCGAVGRLVWEKGYREVFEAATRLRDRPPRVHVVVIGPRDADKRDAVNPADEARAERDGRVRFLGARDDMVDLYAAMDLSVLASHREGFPRAAMEAAAMGRPLVATDVRGGRQVVDHGRTGLLVPPRDPAALATAIATLAADPATRAQMGAAARAKAAREFDERRVVEITLDVYCRLLRMRPRHRVAA